jgi:hypothetical protein
MNCRNIALLAVPNTILLVIVAAQLDFLTVSQAELANMANPLKAADPFGLVFVAIFGVYKDSLTGE